MGFGFDNGFCEVVIKCMWLIFLELKENIGFSTNYFTVLEAVLNYINIYLR